MAKANKYLEKSVGTAENVLKGILGDKTLSTPEMMNSAKKIYDFFSVIKNVEGMSAIKAMGNSEDMVTDLDNWVKKHTHEKYDTYESLVKSNDADAMELLDRNIQQEIRYLASVHKHPRAIKEDENLSKEFKNQYAFYGGIARTANKATVALNGDMINVSGDLLVNRANLFKQYRPVNEAYAELEGIVNSTENYMSKARKYMENMIRKHTDNIVSDDFLEKNVGFLDGSYQDGEARIRTSLENSKIDEDNYAHAMGKLKAFQRDWNLFNYGVPDPAEVGFTKEMAKDNRFTTSVKFGGESIPTFLNFILNTGDRMHAVIGKRTSSLHDIEKVTQGLFGPDGKFQIRANNYMPSNKDDILNSITGNTAFSKLYGDVAFLKQRQTLLDNHEAEPVKFMDIFTNNIKAFQHYANRVSEYSTARVMKDSMKDNLEFQEANKTVYKSISHFADTIIKDYEKAPEVVSENVQSFKKLAGAAAGLVASTILMNSAPANYAAGAITIMSRLGITKPWKMRSAYKSALTDTDFKGDVAREVKNYFTNFSPFSKVSDVITKDTSMKEIGVNNIMDKISNAMLSVSDTLVTKGIMGSIPGFRWLAFNESENRLLSISEALAYDGAAKAAQMAKDAANRDGKSFNTRDFIRTYLKDSSDAVFTMTKESVGDFSRYAKPIWSWKILRDANTATAVITGTLATMTYMFKQVEAVNAHVLNRVSHAIKYPMKNEFAAPASAGMGIGIALLAMYEWLAKEEDNIPRVGLAMKSSPTSGYLGAVRGLKGMIKVVGNQPVSEQEANDIADFARTVGGVAFGSMYRGDAAMPEGGLKNVVDNFSFNMDFGVGFFKTLSDGLFQEHSVGEVYEFDKAMKDSLNKNTLLVNLSNDPIRFVEDAAVAANALYSSVVADNPKQQAGLIKTFGRKIGQTFQRMLGASVYYGPEHYKNTAYMSYDYDNDDYRTEFWSNRTKLPGSDALVYAINNYGYIPKEAVYKDAVRRFERGER